MRIVLGTADLREEPRTTQLLDRFYEAGGRAIDVANVYGDGKSERAVGSWLRRRGVRDVVLYSKGCHPPYCSPELVSAEVSQALALLGVDRVDVFMLHRDDPSVPVSAFADALQQEVAAGRIGGFGVSNWALTRFHELVDYSGGGGGPVAFSNHFSLGEMVTPTWPGCLSSTRDEVAAVGGDGAEILPRARLPVGYSAGAAGRRRRGPRPGRGTPAAAHRPRGRQRRRSAGRLPGLPPPRRGRPFGRPVHARRLEEPERPVRERPSHRQH